MREIEKMFITGVYGSGKTYFAERYGKRHRLPYKNFDLLHDYTSKKNQSKKILNDLRTSFIIDAIPCDVCTRSCSVGSFLAGGVRYVGTCTQ
jgi:hypothetical protein